MSEIVAVIKIASFPDSEKLLSQEIRGTQAVDLLSELQATKAELSQNVGSVCKHYGHDVNDWILQARQVQQDVAQCKEDYGHIVTQHSQLEQSRLHRDEVRSNIGLLNSEITFNETLQKHIKLLAEISQRFDQADEHIKALRLLPAANALSTCVSVIRSIASDRCQAMLSQIYAAQLRTLTTTLQSLFDTLCSVEDNEKAVEIAIRPESDHAASLIEVLDCAQLMNVVDSICVQFGKRVSTAVWHHSHKHSKHHIIDAQTTVTSIQLALSPEPVPVIDQLRLVRSLFQFLSERLPDSVRNRTLNEVADALLPRLKAVWLDISIPISLDDLQSLSPLQESVKQFAEWLRVANITQANDFEHSLTQIPKMWLAKRRAASLEFVRKALHTASGTTRQVQRVETDTVEVEQSASGNDGDDWNQERAADGGDEVHLDQRDSKTQVDDEDSDAWGFDDDEGKQNEASANSASHPDSPEDEESEAWGWGDDEAATADNTSSKQPGDKVNGRSQLQSKKQEMTLTENYTITDIPDYILEQVGRDLADFHTLQSSGQLYFDTSTLPAKGLQSLPTEILAMFKATAVEHYASTSPLSRMNLYNDALYIAQKLAEKSESHLQNDILLMSKFARAVYSAEISTQRTVLLDLLDNAQGFVSCAVEPYLSQCGSAISSTTEYIRALHAQWLGILSVSHLAQTIGSLISSIMSKMIKEIEDMEDIQESESRQLLHFMERVSTLEDLFKTETPVQPNHKPTEAQEISSTIALYVPNYLRFQYLQQILDSSLADIRYMWTEAGLSAEFDADEVVDLIKALFAESSHRRSAIQAIKASR